MLSGRIVESGRASRSEFGRVVGADAAGGLRLGGSGSICALSLVNSEAELRREGGGIYVDELEHVDTEILSVSRLYGRDGREGRGRSGGGHAPRRVTCPPFARMTSLSIMRLSCPRYALVLVVKAVSVRSCSWRERVRKLITNGRIKKQEEERPSARPRRGQRDESKMFVVQCPCRTPYPPCLSRSRLACAGRASARRAKSA